MEAHSLLTAFGLGLLGFVEPCSVGASLLFIQSLEMQSARDKIFHAVTFALTRALIIGALGALAAGIGTAFFGLQKASWIVLGTAYVAVGMLYLAGWSRNLKHGLGPSFSKLVSARASRWALCLVSIFQPAPRRCWLRLSPQPLRAASARLHQSWKAFSYLRSSVSPCRCPSL